MPNRTQISGFSNLYLHLFMFDTTYMCLPWGGRGGGVDHIYAKGEKVLDEGKTDFLFVVSRLTE